MASSFVDGENSVKLGDVLAVIETVGEHPERKGLGLCNSFIARRAVGEDSGQVGHFSDPASVVFPFDVDRKFAHQAYSNASRKTDRSSDPEISWAESSSGLHESSSGLHEPSSGLHEPSSGLHESMSGLHESMSGLHESMSGLRESMSGLHESMNGLHESMSGLHESMSGLHESMSGLHEFMSGLHGCAASAAQLTSLGR